MIWFWVVAGLLVVGVLIALLRPLLRGAGSADQGESVLAVFRGQLAAIDTEIAQGRLTADEAATARAEITRRMLAAADRETEAPTPATGGASDASSRIAAAVAIAALLPTAALAIYATVGTPAAIGPGRTGGAAGLHDRAQLETAADQLKAKLEREPGHLEGWVLLGRTFASLQRFADARDAYNHAIALAPNEPRLHAELGEVLVATAEGNVTPEAQAEFAKSGDDPRARFYGAEAALQRGDQAAAVAALKALLADAPADAPWRQAVADRLAEIAPAEAPSGAPPQVSAGAPAAGPNAGDIAAAQSMSPAERQAMIRGMVDRLAARLEANPNDKEGWSRLAHAYDVLGETAKAEAARARAAQASPSAN